MKLNGVEMFQSLTGAIQTNPFHQNVFSILKFQSLTGAIQTNSSDFKNFTKLSFNPSQVRFKLTIKLLLLMLNRLFQSLTGAIQTCFEI